MNRHILHVDMDAFFVSAERLKHPELEGLPVIIGGNAQQMKGVVSACSYEARTFGLHSAMSIADAKRLCPQGVFIKGSHDSYTEFSDIITEIIANRSPLFEKASIDEFYIDMTGMEKFQGTYKWASELRQAIIQETRLPVSFGLSVNKTVAKIATDHCKPNGKLQIPGSEVKSFLASLPVGKIPGVGAHLEYKLNEMGIRQISHLQEIPEHLLTVALGKWGRVLWLKAQGEDHDPVLPYREEKSISRETTLPVASTDPLMLTTLLCQMCEELCHELRLSAKLSTCLTIKIRYADFETHTRQVSLSPCADERTLLPIARSVFTTLFERRVSVRLIGVKLSRFCPDDIQTHLFQDNEAKLQLQKTTDVLKKRFGTQILSWASSLNIVPTET